MYDCTSRLWKLALAVALTLVVSPTCAQDWARKMFVDVDHDFGNVARGAATEYRFRLTNLYKEDVHISGVSSSCGCTSPSITKDLIKTGQKSDIVAKFNTVGFQGSHSATVTVTFDQPFVAMVQLQVRGYVRRDVVITPGRVDLGTVDAGTPKERNIEVAYAGRDDWEIIDVRSANNNFEVELTPKGRGNGRVDYSLLVRLKPTAPAGFINDRLTLVTNDAQSKLIPLAVEGNVVSAVTVSPTSLQLGTVKLGETTAKKQIIVRAKSPFKIVRIDCDNPGFKFQTSSEAKSLHMIPVTYTAGDKAGSIVEKIRIITDGSSGGSLPEIVAHVEVEKNTEQASK